MNITALRQKKTDTLAKARAISATAIAANRDLTDAERIEFDAVMASIETLNGDIKRAEALLDAERTAPAIEGAIAGHNNAEDEPISTGAFLMAVKDLTVRGGHVKDARLQAALGTSETSDADGGFLVPQENSSKIIERIWEEGQVCDRADRTPMKSSKLVIPGVNEDSRLPGFRYGGIQVFRVSEAGTYTPSKPNFKLIELNANDLIALMYATRDLLEDTDMLENWASKTVPKALAFQQDDECINGTGAGMFQGILQSPALVTVNKDSSQATGTISTSNILNMHAAMLATSRRNAVWYINQNCEQQLYQLTIPGEAGTAVALYVFPGTGSNVGGQYGKILGHPVIPIEQCQSLSTKGDIILADMSEYLIGDRTGVKADSSIHVQFLTGQTAFRWFMRNDGRTKQKAPLTPYKGSQALSSFVALQTR